MQTIAEESQPELAMMEAITEISQLNPLESQDANAKSRVDKMSKHTLSMATDENSAMLQPRNIGELRDPAESAQSLRLSVEEDDTSSVYKKSKGPANKKSGEKDDFKNEPPIENMARLIR